MQSLPIQNVYLLWSTSFSYVQFDFIFSPFTPTNILEKHVFRYIVNCAANE